MPLAPRRRRARPAAGRWSTRTATPPAPPVPRRYAGASPAMPRTSTAMVTGSAATRDPRVSGLAEVVDRRGLALEVLDLDALEHERDLLEARAVLGQGRVVDELLDLGDSGRGDRDPVEDDLLAALVGAHELEDRRLDRLVGHQGLEDLG